MPVRQRGVDVRALIKTFYHRMKYGQAGSDFVLMGCLPRTPDYADYKWSSIRKVIFDSNFEAVVGTDRYGYRIDERIVELPWLLSRLPRGQQRLLDAGSALNFEPIIFHPRIAEKKLFIVTL